jgi:hypothetical protein
MTRKALGRIASGISLLSIAGFSLFLFLLHSPRALPLTALLVFPFGINVVWFITGSRTIDLVPLFRRLKGWKAATAIGVSWLLLLYMGACFWWLLKGAK